MPRARLRPPSASSAPPPAPTGDPAGARRLLAAFALHAGPLPPEWLARLATSPSDVDALTAGRLIAEGADGAWMLATPGDAAAHLRAAPWSVRQALHDTLARLCREAGRHADEARHLAALGQTRAAITAWLAAIKNALACPTPESAITALDEMVRLGAAADDASVSDLVVALETCAAQPALAEPLMSRLPRWLEQPEWRARPALAAPAALILAGFESACGRHAAGAALRIRAAEAFRSAGDLRAAARQLTAAAGTLTFAVQFTAARHAALEAVVAAEACNDIPCRIDATATLGLLLGMQGETAAGRARLEQALDLALRHGQTSAAAEAYRMLGTVAEYASCYGDEQAAFARALSYCRRHDATATAELCMGCLSYSLFRSGNWLRSRTVARGVLARPGAVSHCVAEGVLGLLHAHRGEAREATQRLESSRAAAFGLGLLVMEFFCAWGLAVVDQQAGRPESAALHYQHLLDFWRGTEDRHDGIPGLTAGALFFLERGEARVAADFCAALTTIAASTANPEAEGAVAVVTGERLFREGRFTAAVAQFEQALRAFARRELLLERILTLVRLGAALRATGDHAGAERACKEARQRGRRLGLRGLLGGTETPAKSVRAPDAAGITRVTEVAEASDGWSGLSPRQRDVARLLCTGATNKEIAARLGLGVRTIDMHVGHVLSRLECRGRTEAVARITSILG